MDDPFISNYIEDLLKNIRTQVPVASSALDVCCYLAVVGVAEC